MGTELVHLLKHLHITTRLGRAVTHIDGPTVVEVLLDIRPATENPKAPPLDLRLVIDRSGSMIDDGKLEAVKEAMLAVVDNLTSKDLLTIISFSAGYTNDLAATKMTPRGKDLARAAIENLQAGGTTFISEAFVQALSQPKQSFETRVVLFTDGESTVNVSEDHAKLVKGADQARSLNLPVLIYGTGGDYNFALLQQLAARVGNGSLLKHVMEAHVLRDHLRSEIGFLRGIGVRGLMVTGSVPVHEVTFVAVTRFMPEQHSVTMDDWPGFTDLSGALDRARGQQYLIKLMVENPTPGVMEILTLNLTGHETAAHDRSFKETISIQATFTNDLTQQSAVDPEVRNVLIRMAATAKAESGDFESAEHLYTRAGDHVTANVMHTMTQNVRRGQRSQAESVRAATSTSRGTVSVAHTNQGPTYNKDDNS